MGAALGGHLRTAALLAERGAYLNAASRTGHTPLMPAALKGNTVRVCPALEYVLSLRARARARRRAVFRSVSRSVPRSVSRCVPVSMAVLSIECVLYRNFPP